MDGLTLPISMALSLEGVDTVAPVQSSTLNLHDAAQPGETDRLVRMIDEFYVANAGTCRGGWPRDQEARAVFGSRRSNGGGSRHPQQMGRVERAGLDLRARLSRNAYNGPVSPPRTSPTAETAPPSLLIRFFSP